MRTVPITALLLHFKASCLIFKPGRGVVVIQETKAEGSRARRVLLAAGLGAIFGFQAWRLALDGYPAAMPWYGALWVFLRHVALGIAVGITGSTSWWKRGAILGVLFSIPSVIALGFMNRFGAAMAIALCVGSIAAGAMTAFLTDIICPRRQRQRSESSRAARPPEPPEPVAEPPLPRNANGASRRLAEGKRALAQIESERRLRGDAAFGQEAEDRIVWRELIELELQELDAHLNHLQSDEDKGR